MLPVLKVEPGTLALYPTSCPSPGLPSLQCVYRPGFWKPGSEGALPTICGSLTEAKFLCEWQAGSLSRNSFYLGYCFLYTLGIIWNYTSEPKQKLNGSCRGTMNLELKSSRPLCYRFEFNTGMYFLFMKLKTVTNVEAHPCSFLLFVSALPVYPLASSATPGRCLPFLAFLPSTVCKLRGPVCCSIRIKD